MGVGQGDGAALSADGSAVRGHLPRRGGRGWAPPLPRYGRRAYAYPPLAVAPPHRRPRQTRGPPLHHRGGAPPSPRVGQTRQHTPVGRTGQWVRRAARPSLPLQADADPVSAVATAPPVTAGAGPPRTRRTTRRGAPEHPTGRRGRRAAAAATAVGWPAHAPPSPPSPRCGVGGGRTLLCQRPWNVAAPAAAAARDGRRQLPRVHPRQPEEW